MKKSNDVVPNINEKESSVINGTKCHRCGEVFCRANVVCFWEDDLNQAISLCKDCLFDFFGHGHISVCFSHGLNKTLKHLRDFTRNIQTEAKSKTILKIYNPDNVKLS